MRRLDTPEYQFALPDERRLRELFERVLRETRTEAREAHTAALREGVCSFVRRAKADGRQIETVIIALKEILGVPTRPVRRFWGEEDAPPPVLLAQQVVRWCIQEYYGPGTDVPVGEG